MPLHNQGEGWNDGFPHSQPPSNPQPRSAEVDEEEIRRQNMPAILISPLAPWFWIPDHQETAALVGRSREFVNDVDDSDGVTDVLHLITTDGQGIEVRQSDVGFSTMDYANPLPNPQRALTGSWLFETGPDTIVRRLIDLGEISAHHLR